MKSNKWLKIAKWLWIIAVIFAGGFFLIKNWDRMIYYFNLIPLINLLLSALFLILAKCFLVFFSKLSLEKEGSFLSYGEMFKVVAITQLGKYIPGGVWHFVGRYKAYHTHQVSIKKSTRALISENIWLLSGAIAIGSLFGVISKNEHKMITMFHIPQSTFGSVIYIFLIFLVWISFLSIYEWLFLNKKQKIKLASFLKLVIVQFITWFLLGLSFFFVLPQFNTTIIPDVIFGYSISWVIGYIAIFAPGGIGIREGVLVWMFSSLFLPEDILVFSTVHRFLFIIVEVILGLISTGEIQGRKISQKFTQR